MTEIVLRPEHCTPPGFLKRSVPCACYWLCGVGICVKCDPPRYRWDSFVFGVVKNLLAVCWHFWDGAFLFAIFRNCAQLES